MGSMEITDWMKEKHIKANLIYLFIYFYNEFYQIRK